MGEFDTAAPDAPSPRRVPRDAVRAAPSPPNCRWTVHLGPPGSGKSLKLVARYRKCLQTTPLGSRLWLAPTDLAALHVRFSLFDTALLPEAEPAAPHRQACLDPGTATIDQFARKILRQTDGPRDFASRMQSRELLGWAVEKLSRGRRLKHFAGVLHTRGFLAGLEDWVGCVKRQDVSAAAWGEWSSQRAQDRKNHELSLIYQTYQELLARLGLLDPADLLGQAAQRYAAWAAEGLAPRRIVVDGFSDFSPSQLRLLSAIGAHADEVHIALPLEQETQRVDLFARPLGALARLKRLAPELAVEWSDRPAAPRRPALAHLERSLFVSPRKQTPATTSVGVRVTACSSDVDELRRVGKRIKRLLLEGTETSHGPVPPERIAVVGRTLAGLGVLVEEVFGELGIPYWLEQPPKLSRCAGLRRLLDWFRLVQEDWPLRRLAAAINSRFFAPRWEEWNHGRLRLELEQLVHELAIPRGRDRFLRAVRSRANYLPRWLEAHRDQVHPKEFEARERENARVAATLPFWNRLAGLLDQIPAQATREEWWNCLKRTAAGTGWFQAAYGGHSLPEGAVSLERIAWSRLKNVWSDGEHLERRLMKKPRPMKLAEFIERMAETLSTESLPDFDSPQGRVNVLSPEGLRGVRVPHLFVVGLAEGSFPQSGGLDGVYSEQEAEELSELGLPWPKKHERRQEEMLLFYETLSKAGETLDLTFAGLDDRAQANLPSPYLLEAEYALNAGASPPVLEREEHLDLSPAPPAETVESAPPDERPASLREFRLHAASAASEGLPSAYRRWRAWEPRPARSVAAAWRMETIRNGRAEFSPFEGMLTTPAAQAWMEGRADRPWNVHQLEAYLHCPFKFYAEELLGIAPWSPLELQTDHRRRGVLLHDSLARLHRPPEAGAPPAQQPGEALAAALDRMIDERCQKEFTEDEVERALLAIDRRVVHDWAARYVEQQEAYSRKLEGRFQPTFLEWSFGVPRIDHEADPRSTQEFLVVAGFGREVRLTGRIDRIDLADSASGDWYHVIDYKTGASRRLTSQAMREGKLLQLPIYILAIERLLLGKDSAPGSQAAYWFLKEEGFEPRLQVGLGVVGKKRDESEPHWEEFAARAEGRVAAVVESISTGAFPVFSDDKECTKNCEFHAVCRIAQVRRTEKTWQLPDLPR